MSHRGRLARVALDSMAFLPTTQGLRVLLFSCWVHYVLCPGSSMRCCCAGCGAARGGCPPWDQCWEGPCGCPGQQSSTKCHRPGRVLLPGNVAVSQATVTMFGSIKQNCFARCVCHPVIAQWPVRSGWSCPICTFPGQDAMPNLYQPALSAAECLAVVGLRQLMLSECFCATGLLNTVCTAGS